MDICLQNCKSSQIAAFGYDAGKQTLAIRFNSGGLYHYSNVPSEVFDQMQQAESVGSFFYRNVKGKFEYQRLVFVPITPAGTPLAHLESRTEEEAWEKLLKDAAHMPYKGKQGFVDRGYTVEGWKK